LKYPANYLEASMTDIPETLDDAYAAYDPTKPLLPTGDDSKLYIDLSPYRGDDGDVIQQIARRIRRNKFGNFSKQLFTGHRGSGKSTELLRLKVLLDSAGYFVIYFDVEAELDISDLDYEDVLLTIAQQVSKESHKAGIKLDDKLLENITRWFASVVYCENESEDVEIELQTEYGLGVDSPLIVFAKMLAAFRGEIKNSTQRRTEIRQELEKNTANLIINVNALIDAAQKELAKQGRQGIVLLIDGLEKVLYRVLDEKTGIDTHTMLFVHHGEQLQSPKCHVVYTFPINVMLTASVGQMFPEISILPMVKTYHRDGKSCSESRNALYDLISRRAKVENIFESKDLIFKIIEGSGGHVRDLLRLIRYASDFTDDKIRDGDFQKAFRKLINEYDYLIKPSDLPRLAEVNRTKQIPSDQQSALLLYNLLVLEYRNGERWADLHPAVKSSRQFETYIEESSKIKKI